MIIRLNKYLADLGTGSRRKCEEYIAKGLIKVNGKVITEMGTKVDSGIDNVEISPEVSKEKAKFAYYMFHKPVGFFCSVSEHEKPSIMDLIKDIPEKVFPVGRLDKMTSGLIFLTNDGRFAYEMTGPGFQKEKEYIVKIREKITPEIIKELTKSFYIKGKMILPPQVTQGGPHLLNIVIKEGRNRQIRRMCENANVTIEKLKRIRIGKFLLGDLETGQYKKATILPE